MRAALYARVSTEDQAEKYGLDAQLRALREFAAKRGHHVTEGGEFVDDGYSGADVDRPALNRLRDAARERTFDVVLVYAPDRLARDLYVDLLLQREFDHAGIEVAYVSAPAADRSPQGQFTRNMLGAVAEFERHVIRDRTLRGKKEKARRGLVPARRLPYGYRQDAAQPGGLGIEPDEARVVEMVFQWVAGGVSVREAVSRLNQLGRQPRAGGRWARGSIRHMLANDIYTGRAWFNRYTRGADGKGPRRLRPASEWIAVPVAPVVSSEVAMRARAQLQRNACVLVGRPSERPYLLKGLLVCGACGRRFRRHSSAGLLYGCSGRDRLIGCRAPRISANAVEREVWEVIVSILNDPDTLLAKVRQHRATLDAVGATIRSDVDDLRRQLAHVGQQQRRLLDLGLADDRLSTALFREKAVELDQRARDLTERLAHAQKRASHEAAAVARHDAVVRYCRTARRGLARLDAQGKQRVLRLLVDRVVIQGRELEIHGVLPARSDPPSPRNPEREKWADCSRSRPASLIRPHAAAQPPRSDEP